MITLQVPHLRLIPDETWVTIQQRRIALQKERDASKVRDPVPKKSTRFLLSGRVICPACGNVMMTSTDHRGERRMTCERSKRRICANTSSFPMKALEVRALQGIEELLADEYDQEFVQGLRAEQEKSQQLDRLEMSRIDRDIKDRDAELTRLAGVQIRLPGDSHRQFELISHEIADGERQLDDLKMRRVSLACRSRNAQEDVERATDIRSAIRSLSVRAPLIAQTPQEIAFKSTFREIVKKVVPVRGKKGNFKVHVTYDIGSLFGVDEGRPVLSFACDSYNDDPGTREIRNRQAAEIASERTLACSEDEFTNLCAVSPFLSHIVECRRRTIIDAIVMSMLIDVSVQEAVVAYGGSKEWLDFEHFRNFRRSKNACRDFAKVLVRSRPVADVSFGKIMIAPRSSRHVKNRLVAVNHPLLRLEQCLTSSEGSSQVRFTQSQIDVVERAAAYFRLVHRQSIVSDLEAIVVLCRHGGAWETLPPEYGPSQGVAQRFNDVCNTKGFAAIVNGLLDLQRDTGDRRMPHVQKVKRYKRSK